MRKFLLILLLATPALAKEPKYSFKDPLLDDQMHQVYRDMDSLLKGTISFSTMTVSSATISTLRVSTLTVTSSGTIINAWIKNLYGTTAADNACAGCVGEAVRGYVQDVNYAATSTWSDATSISLTAGDWDVSLIGAIDGTAVTTSVMGISTTSGNSATGLVVGDNRPITPLPTAAFGAFGYVPAYRMSLGSTTTVYLKIIAAYSGTTPTFTGRLSARRVR